ncbi:hypothetical protein EJ04DRAFT_59273 [Polyplosphaeria fusca]|uniref:Zn(2)-C6 fungal-type domain-containing protein n=1 Tax=Polyplosphaeria fusca TaxID=682080 RepID=A0A9P4QRV7_9PLEO|nr:hypothetical protein EJ04DRAFT_59273 [Polyplosphaeria fusca]
MANEGPAKKKRRGGSRRKTGCYTCKTRHSRCDEKKPICSSCERLHLECKPSDFIAPSEWTIETPSASHVDQEDSIPAPFPSEEPEASIGFDPMLDTSIEHIAPPDNNLTSTWDIFKSHIGLDVLDDSPPTEALANMLLPASASTSVIPQHELVTSVSLTTETVFLLQTYLRTVATWMDLMDHTLTYQLTIPKITLTCPLIFHGICAFTAKHLALSNSKHNQSWEPIARKHYGSSLTLLIQALNSPHREHCLTATILLSSYEVISSVGAEHRRHFLGAYSLLKSHHITARSTGIPRANFWIYVRHEISVALATERPIIFCPDEWDTRWRDAETREDVLACQVLWMLARTINLVYGAQGRTVAGRALREAMLRELEAWRLTLSDTFVGIPYGEADEHGFHAVYFTVTAAAAAAFWYHVTHILLYAEPEMQHVGDAVHVQEHAMRTANIAISDFPDALRVFASHGLYFAAKHIEGIARKARIWNILNDVEIQLGYHTKTIVRKLQQLVEEGK